MCDRRKSRILCLTRLAEISGEFIPYTKCSIPKVAIGDFQRGAGSGYNIRYISKEYGRFKFV